jgi:LysM repeat protein
MEAPQPDDRAQSFRPPAARRRRFSPWTIIAPVAAIVLWVSFFSALGKSCVFKDCANAKDKGSQTAAEASGIKQNDLPRGAKVKIRTGDNLGAIARKYQLTEDELKACNPLVDAQALQPGTFLLVSSIDCKGADKAGVGANPDPLAGDTVGPESTAPEQNGTAAADPSAKSGAPDTTTSTTGN